MITHEEAIKLLKRYGNDQEDVMELYRIIENELEDTKHNYGAIKEMHNNSVSYASKIQKELDDLKRNVARYFDLDDFKTSLTDKEWEEYKELRKTIQKGVVK